MDARPGFNKLKLLAFNFLVFTGKEKRNPFCATILSISTVLLLAFLTELFKKKGDFARRWE